MSYYFSAQGKSPFTRKALTLKFSTKKQLFDYIDTWDLPENSDFDNSLERYSKEYIDQIIEVFFEKNGDIFVELECLVDGNENVNATFENGRLLYW